MYSSIPIYVVCLQNIYFPKVFFETLNLKVLNKFNLDQNFSEIHVHPNYQYFEISDPCAYDRKRS